MSETSTLDRLKPLLVEHLCLDDDQAAALTPESRIVEDLGGDSLDLVELEMAAEEAWRIEIPAGAGFEVDATVADLVRVIDANRA